MKFNSFDKAKLNILRAELEAVLWRYGADANLEISVGVMRYAETQVDITLKAAVAAVAGAATRESKALDAEVERLNITKTNAKGDVLVEYLAKNWKMPFIYVKKSDGKRYKCSEDMAKFMFRK